VIRTITSQPITAAVGLVAGLLIGYVSLPSFSWVGELYDEAHPVLSLNARVDYADDAEIVLRAEGRKLRACQYVRLQAYTVDRHGTLSDAQIQRIDQHEDRDAKPLGTFDFGRWRIWPRGDAVAVQVFSQHLCSGRMTVTKVIDVKVPA
jgi:hypothetical protein